MIDHSTSDGSIYPGVYERSRSEKELNNELCRTGAHIKFPSVSMKQLGNHFRIEMSVPGFNREDFFIHSKGHSLSVSAMNTKKSRLELKDSSNRSGHCECMFRNILLPIDVDTNFVSAEYRNGILCICLFKFNHAVENIPEDIIVY